MAPQKRRDPRLDEIDAYEHALLRAYDESHSDAAEVARDRPAVVAAAKTTCDRLRAAYVHAAE